MPLSKSFFSLLVITLHFSLLLFFRIACSMPSICYQPLQAFNRFPLQHSAYVKSLKPLRLFAHSQLT